MSGSVLRRSLGRLRCANLNARKRQAYITSTAAAVQHVRQNHHDASAEASTSVAAELETPKGGKMASGTSIRRKKKAAVKSELVVDPDDATYKAELKTLLSANSVVKHLQAIASARETSFHDIESIVPQRSSPPGSDKYVEEYNNFLDKLLRSFSRKQLYRYSKQQKLPARSNTKKPDLCMYLMEKQWGWPSLSEIQRRQRDRSEILSRKFIMTAPEAFLLLGQDGSNLLDLSMKYNVHVRFEANPVSMTVEGVKVSLDALEEELHSFKKDVVQEVFQLPTQRETRSDLLRRISRMTTALAESIGPGEIRFTYVRGDNSVCRAKRLATRASCETENKVDTPLLAYRPAPPAQLKHLTAPSLYSEDHALYPFLPSRALPWTVTAGGAFRVRRVGAWLSLNTSEDILSTGGLAGMRGENISSNDQHHDLLEVLSPSSRPAPFGTTRSIVASTGHVIFVTPFTGGKSSLLPPLKGSWPLKRILVWARDLKQHHLFNGSAPATFIQPLPGQQQLLHRLVYYALPSVSEEHQEAYSVERLPQREFLEVEIELTLSKTSTSTPFDDDAVTDIEPRSLVPPINTGGSEVFSENILAEKSEVPHGNETTDSFEPLADEGQILDEPTASQVPQHSFPVVCIAGTERVLDLMMPNRPMDLRFTVTDTKRVSHEEQPQLIQKYLANLKSFLLETSNLTQPHTPVMVEYQGMPYVLYSSLNVRQRTDISNGVKVVSEIALDLEGSEKSTLCKAFCNNTSSDAEWTSFLQRCDRITSEPRAGPDIDRVRLPRLGGEFDKEQKKLWATG
ncbi:hypothetical protein FISHEDRAFT_76662 [Fistulina hepatica ATCC 64428]|uniref:Uncharacterized protein n=1 Tax=Fistulina hepatica ATCC 64428 TaxID=1128425 RepID=A0A0D7A3V7_9AGAR|nr:hypothetical protein FISHEDRAFT_76662 [Fistulina hepatica ATCC 64428]